jgi:hypothetical protein
MYRRVFLRMYVYMHVCMYECDKLNLSTTIKLSLYDSTHEGNKTTRKVSFETETLALTRLNDMLINRHVRISF